MSLSQQPSDLLVLLTRPLDQLKKLAVQANMPCTESKILEKGLQLIRNASDFEYALTQWEDKNPADKTWANFKTHFHDHQVKLKKVRGPTMQQGRHHHTNVLVSRISQDMDEKSQERDNNIIAMLQSSLTRTSCSSSLHTVDKEGKNYCGLTINWHYKKGYGDIAMLKCTLATLKKLLHTPNIQPQHSPHEHVSMQYTRKG